ncbi:MAG: S53 family peptidase [Candidatus Sulfotelmatobacter sp.]
MRTSRIRFLMLFLVLGVLPSALAQTAAHAALPYPNATTPKAIDHGELKAQSGTTPISITIAVRLPKLNEAENLLKALHTPGDPQFHQFLTADQFVARFGPANADVAKVIAALAKYGLTAARTTATTLKVTGLPADMERAFSVSLHTYEIPAHDNVPGYTFHAPLTSATIPAEISAVAAAVVGLDSRPRFRPLSRTVSPKLRMASSVSQKTTPDEPGLWTVTDFPDYYDVQPLYHRGVTGSGRTIGIVTFASFTPSDAFAYWSAVGLSVNPNRIQIVNVDGGPGAPSDVSGSDETTLDVEQSGGIAPGARIIVYQAPGTGQGSIDDFAAAIDGNSAETVSVSWGDWEECANRGIGDFPSACMPPDPTFVEATHELFVRAAIQGQTLFAAAGDDGAYDNVIDCPTGDLCSNPLSVDYPASDTAITAGGGTTLPGLQEYCLNAACTPPFYDINIPHERVWGWDYLIGLCSALGYNPITCGIFPIGSGGGVSIVFEEPLYQFFLPGTQLSQPGQSWIVNGELVYALPAYHPGRNVPDISLNADPDTGYVLYYTSEPSGVFGIDTYIGGTSFVAPQLNGVSALLGQDLHARLGLLNFPLYLLGLTGQGYRGPHAPFHAIRYGDNWFYYGSHGYNPAVGFGTLDVANFAEALRGPF